MGVLRQKTLVCSYVIAPPTLLTLSDQRDDEANRRFMAMLPEEPDEEDEESELVSLDVINNDGTCVLIKIG